MPNPLHMLEYLQYAGIDIKPLTNEEAIQKEYLRQIYRVDSREKMLNSKGKMIGKSSSPRNLH